MILFLSRIPAEKKGDKLKQDEQGIFSGSIRHLESLGTFDATNMLMVIPKHKTIEITPRHVLHSISDYIKEEDKTVESSYGKW